TTREDFVFEERSRRTPCLAVRIKKPAARPSRSERARVPPPGELGLGSGRRAHRTEPRRQFRLRARPEARSAPESAMAADPRSPRGPSRGLGARAPAPPGPSPASGRAHGGDAAPAPTGPVEGPSRRPMSDPDEPGRAVEQHEVQRVRARRWPSLPNLAVGSRPHRTSPGWDSPAAHSQQPLHAARTGAASGGGAGSTSSGGGGGRPLSSAWQAALGAAEAMNTLGSQGVPAPSAQGAARERRRPPRKGPKVVERPLRALFCLGLGNPLRKLCISVVEWKYPSRAKRPTYS
ncbi:hypothetical protein HPB47_005746, partial [Ixodes persulcatus]